MSTQIFPPPDSTTPPESIEWWRQQAKHYESVSEFLVREMMRIAKAYDHDVRAVEDIGRALRSVIESRRPRASKVDS